MNDKDNKTYFTMPVFSTENIKGNRYKMTESRVDMQGIMREISEKIINLKDKAVRDMLIKEGWTPPK